MLLLLYFYSSKFCNAELLLVTEYLYTVVVLLLFPPSVVFVINNAIWLRETF